MVPTGRARLVLVIAAVVVLLAGAIVLALAGRDTGGTDSHGPGGDGEYGTLGPQPEGADPATATKYALVAMFSWQPVTDYGPGAAMARATPWLTGYLATEATAPPATGIRPLAEWSGWREAKDIVVALVTVTGVGQPTGGECVVTAEVRQIVQHTSNTTTPWRTMTVSASVSKTATGWKMANYRVTG